MTGIILAGGQSSRIGCNKALLEISGKKIIQRTVTLFKEVFEEIIIVTNDPLIYESFDIRIVTDIEKERGSLMGIYSGLLSSTSHYNFIVACDMPFIHKSIIDYLIDKREGYDVVVPYCLGRFQPLHAVYSKTCIKPLEALICSGDMRITNLFKRVKTKEVEEKELKEFDPNLKSFININTPEDLTNL